MSTRRVLIGLLAAPIAWTMHLLMSYAIIAVGCSFGWLTGTRVAIAALTVVLTLAALSSAWATLRDWPRPIRLIEWAAHTEQDEPMHAFLRGLGLLATLVFVLSIVLGGFGSLMVPLCAQAVHH
ncbi:MAG TPA: hypothetical protein VHG09_14375 [Longimicrobiales bacterium]|nr:hypothetical protein [Longimicrobiales bacterium]